MRLFRDYSGYQNVYFYWKLFECFGRAQLDF